MSIYQGIKSYTILININHISINGVKYEIHPADFPKRNPNQ